ncbi:Transcriptional corepressor LEUNIG_HOMOLOG [Linum perenne]
MAQSNWEADKMLDVYIHDYLLKRKLLNSAKAFMAEGKVATDPVAIDAPGGFLFEWWSVFWDIFIARTNEKHSEAAAAYIEAQHTKAREQQQVQMQQLQLLQQRSAQMQRRDPSHPALAGSISAVNSQGIIGQPSASVLAMKLYEEQMKHPHSMDSDTSPAIIDGNRMTLVKSGANHQGQMVHGNTGNVSSAMQQIQPRAPLTPDIKPEVNLGPTQKSLPMDPASIYGQAILHSKSGLGVNQGASGLPLKGWPLTGIDQLRPNLGMQMQKPNIQPQNQYLLASQQQVLAQAQAQSNLGNSTNYGDIDPRRLSQLPRGSFNPKDSQATRNDGPVCSPVQSSSPKIKIEPSSSQQQNQLPQQQPTQQQIQQNNRKRKQNTSSGPANSTGTGNTVGPPCSPPSTHTPSDGMAPGNMQHVNSAPKSLMMYGQEATAGLVSSNMLCRMTLKSLGILLLLMII